MAKRRYAVLLRGINLGRHNKVPMPELRGALAAAGFEDVATLVQSGNVVVTSEAKPAHVATEVRRVVKDGFGVDTPAIVVDRPALQAVVAGCPMPEPAAANPKLFNVVFLDRQVTARLLGSWDPTEPDPENIRVGNQVIYQWCPEGFQNAPQLLPQLERRWRVTGTVRNWNTTTRLLDMLDAAEDAR